MGDEVTTGAVATLFVPIQAPRIKSISRKDVRDFLLDLHSYENLTDALSSLAAVSYRSFLDPDYLKSYGLAEVFGE